MIECSRDCIKVLDLDGRLLSMNAGGMEALEICDLEPFQGALWIDFWKGTGPRGGPDRGRGRARRRHGPLRRLLRDRADAPAALVRRGRQPDSRLGGAPGVDPRRLARRHGTQALGGPLPAAHRSDRRDDRRRLLQGARGDARRGPARPVRVRDGVRSGRRRSARMLAFWKNDGDLREPRVRPGGHALRGRHPRRRALLSRPGRGTFPRGHGTRRMAGGELSRASRWSATTASSSDISRCSTTAQ